MASEASRVLKLIIMGVDEYSPTLNRLNGSLTNTGRVVNNQMGGMTRSTGLLSEQFKILRRTAEYAVAGFGIYKVIQAISAYKQFRTELGNLNTTLNLSGTNIGKWGQMALDISSKTTAPLHDVQQSLQNIAQTFPGINRQLAGTFATIEAKYSRIMDVTPLDFGSTVGQSVTAFYGRGVLKNPNVASQKLENMAGLLFGLRRTTPRITGQDITQNIGNLFAGAVSTSGFTPTQALSLFSVVQQSGGRSAQNINYVRQLMLRLRKPPTGAEPYFQRAGVGEQQRSKMGGMEILTKLISYAASLPGGSSPKDLQESLTKGSNKRIGLTGPALDFIVKSIGGRIQSQIAISAIIHNLGQVKLQEENITKAAQDGSKAFDRWLAQNRFTQASNDLNVMTTSMINDLNPLLMKIATIGDEIAKWAIQGNKSAQSLAGGIGKVESRIPGVGSNAARYHLGGVTEIVGAALAAYGLNKTGVFGALGKGANKIPGFSKLFSRGGGGQSLLERRVGNAIRGPLDLQALSSALTGQANGTATAPFWVVIHPLSAQTVPGMFSGKNSKNNTNTVDSWFNQASKVGVSGYVAKKAATKSGLARLAAKLGPKLLPFAESDFAKQLGPAAVIASFLTDPGNLNTGIPSSQGNMVGVGIGDYGRRVRKGSIADVLFNRRGVHGIKRQGLLEHIAQEPFSQKALLQFTTHQISEKKLEQLILAGTAPTLLANAHRSKASSGVIGNADILATFFLQPTDELKALLKPQKVRAHVPTKLHGAGSPAPTSRGRSTNRNT